MCVRNEDRKISSSLFVQDVLLHSTDELTLQGWMLHDKNLYRVSTTKKGWRASREDCQKRKADLVVINNREELVCVKVKVKVKVCLLLHVPNCFSTAKFLRLGIIHLRSRRHTYNKK